MATDRAVAVVLGGAGFIGSHVARALMHDYHVRVVDQYACSYMREDEYCHEFVAADLRDAVTTARVVRGASAVLLFAADMGGMGYIALHEGTLMVNNTRITVNAVEACRDHAVHVLLIASSACVYPESLQDSRHIDASEGARAIRLAEDMAWHGRPQDGYGIEKLYGEELARSITGGASPLRVRAVRFHNVYGPRGTWHGGREKAPAAMLRKALALALLRERGGGLLTTDRLELWNSGDERRSFLFIDDAVHAVLRALTEAAADTAVLFQVYNVGSPDDVSIRELAALCCSIAGIPASLMETDRQTGPAGVGHRSSDNARVSAALKWEPRVPLDVGLRRTADWMKQQIAASGALMNGVLLRHFLSSELTSAAAAPPRRFAVLLPVTSRGSDDIAASLTRFFAAFAETASRGDGWHYDFFIGIDVGDAVLDGAWPAVDVRAMALSLAPALSVSAFVRRFALPPGSICAIWRDLAADAHRAGCDYFVLLGDDVVLETPRWPDAISDAFAAVSRAGNVPFGFGCVAFADRAFPGFPTFPVVHRTHMDIFDGRAFPSAFVNQDADPFLFALYAHFGCAKMLADVRLVNAVGGAGDARYTKRHTAWTGAVLRNAVERVSEWLERPPFVSLDIVVPTFRADRDYLERFIALERPPGVATTVILQFDDPLGKADVFRAMSAAHAHNPFVRIRMNKENMGAGPTRNRGLAESSADFVLFLDDDVVPDARILHAYADAIRAHPTATGFVGPTLLPPPSTVRQLAIHMADLPYFWDIALKHPCETELPWGVTANLCVRRDADGLVAFSDCFPRTGGGEDIDYCLKARQLQRVRIGKASKGLVAVPAAVAHHPYWGGGACPLAQFFGWSNGDGHLIDLYPALTYMNAPDLCEALLIVAVAAAVASLVLGGALWPFATALAAGVAMMAADVAFEIGWQVMQKERFAREPPWRWAMAVPMAVMMRSVSQSGRLWGHWRRGRLAQNVCWRFNWFGDMWPGAVQVERAMEARRWTVRVAFLVTALL